MTATPASDVEGVQQIIDNLNISKVEVRTEQSIDIVRHMKRKTVERKTCYPSSEITECIELLAEGITPVLNTAKKEDYWILLILLESTFAMYGNF